MSPIAESFDRFRMRAVIGMCSSRATHTLDELSRSVGMCSRTNPTRKKESVLKILKLQRRKSGWIEEEN